MRAGAHALSLLAVPLNVHVLTALAEPMPLMDLRYAVGMPPETTMRGHLRTLGQLRIVERRRQRDFPGSVNYALDGPGAELIEVARGLDTWLASCPLKPLRIGTAAARSAIKALAEGWSSAIVRALAARPLSLTELNRLISALNYPSLERRLTALRLAGLIESSPNGGRSRPYVPTSWLRQAAGPLTLATDWERRHAPAETSPVGRIDVEAAFLLALPGLRLPENLYGAVRLAVETSNGGDRNLSGVRVEVQDGRVTSCTARLEGTACAWAVGSSSSWLRSVIEHDTDLLEVGGDCELVLGLIDRLHDALCGARERA